jgi:hypothetical protein
LNYYVKDPLRAECGKKRPEIAGIHYRKWCVIIETSFILTSLNISISSKFQKKIYFIKYICIFLGQSIPYLVINVIIKIHFKKAPLNSLEGT